MESPTSPESAGTLLVLQLKPFVGFKSQDEYLYAMKEDLAEWFTCLYQIEIGVDNFFDVLDTGVRLCKHANNVRNFAHERRKLGLLDEMNSNFVRGIQMPHYEVQYREEVKPQTFQARDNISNFIKWTKDAGIPEVLSFETDDLVLRKNEKNVVLCLLEIARIGAKLGMLAPTIVQMEEEIDAEIAGDPPPQIITCDVKSLDEMVKWLAGRCTCPVQFPIIKVGEGKYKIGDNQTLVFVRILRKHVMIRVGGGWDTLEHYLDKHDPCRCGFAGHRSQGPGQRLPTTPRRSSTPVLSQTLPSSMKSPRKHSLVSNSYQGVQRPPSPVRMRSASPGPNPRKLPTQPNTNLSGSSSLSSNGNTNSNVNGSKNNSVSNQTPVNNRLRSPSPVPSATKKTQGVPNNRPTSPLKRCSSPAPAKRCTSPSPARKSLSQTPSKHKILATSRSTPSTPSVQRRQLPQPKVDSCGNSEMSDSGSGNSVPSMEQISTMTLDEFKNLLNNALSVPNGNASEASLDSPRSQSSTDSFRNYSISKKPPVSDQKAKTWGHSKASNVSKSFDSNYRGVKNNTILEKPELPEKPKKILTQSASWNRPKTPTSTNRPKTPVSSATNRPKTPVAPARSKTAVVSSTRPKTPTSSTRSYTPVSNTYCSLDSKNEVSKNKSNNFSVDWTNRKLSYSNSDNDSTELNESTRMNTNQTQQQNYVTNAESAARLSQVNTSRDKTSMGSFTGMMASKFQEDNQKSNGLIQTSSFKNTTDYKSMKSDTNSQLYSNKPSSVSMKSDGSYFNSTEEQRPNIGYVAINAEDDKYECKRKQGISALTSSNNIVEQVQSQLGLTDSIKKESNKYNSSSAMESKLDLFKKTFQSSSETEQTSNTSEFLQNNPYNRQNSREKEFSDLILPEEKHIESDNECKSNLQQLPPRPSTPSGRCTPSLIPRPCTPVGNLKEIKEKAEKLINEDMTTVTKSIENLTSLLTEQASPLTTEAPSRKITPPSQSSVSSVKSVVSPQSSITTNGNANNSGRPPTPRKSNILVKAQTPSANSKGSYTSQFMQRRAMTPGPTKTENKIVPVRRSTTPGPGDRDNFLRRSENFEIDLNEPKTISTSQSQNLRSSTNFSEGRQSRTVPSSPVVQRRPRTPSAEPRSLSRQPAVDEESIVVTVDRSKGQHNINVQKNGESSYKSPKPTSSRIIARSPAAGRPKQNVSDNAEQNKLRSRSVDLTQQHNRSQSIDRTRNRKESNQGEVVLTVSKNQGSHVVNKRTEAWVEDAAKTVAKTRHGSKLNKSLSQGYQRSKTPNPIDMRNQQSRTLEEIKAALSLPINGMTISTETLEAPPEDPEMYDTMDKLFEQMRKKELRASVNETPGIPQNDVPNGNDDEYSLDSNENVKRKISVPSKPSSRQSTPSRESVSSTPSRSKTPSISRSSSSSQPVNRPASTPPRPCTPVRSKTSSRRSSASIKSDDSSELVKRSSVNHATVLVSKIKEILNVKPRKDNVGGPKTRIPAPASLAKTGKSRSFSNLSATADIDNPYNRHSFESNMTNGDYNCDTYDDYDDCANEVGYYSRNNGSDSNSDRSDKYRSGSGSKTPVPKIATPLSTGRTSLLNNQRDNSRSSQKLIRALSASSLSSTTSQTFSYSAADDDGYV